MSLSKVEVATIDATPNKKIYLSIIADYGLTTALFELVDNAYDCWNHPIVGQELNIEITLDVDQQKIVIADNAGGVKEKDLDKLISPGASTADGRAGTIGVFGVGSKRAVVALSQLVQITTRFRKEGTYRVEYDDEWLANPDWHIPYYKVTDAAPSSTNIALSNLRFTLKNEDVLDLTEQLSYTYAKILSKGRFHLSLNGKVIEAKSFEHWAYPQEAAPKSFEKILKLEAKR